MQLRDHAKPVFAVACSVTNEALMSGRVSVCILGGSLVGLTRRPSSQIAVDHSRVKVMFRDPFFAAARHLLIHTKNKEHKIDLDTLFNDS